MLKPSDWTKMQAKTIKLKKIDLKHKQEEKALINVRTNKAQHFTYPFVQDQKNSTIKYQFIWKPMANNNCSASLIK